MDLQERLQQLENVRDWQGLVEELEKGIQSSNANEAKAVFHLRLGQVLEAKFLAGVKALKHFQDAYKLNPALAESLEAARRRRGPFPASCSSSFGTCSAILVTTTRRRARMHARSRRAVVRTLARAR